MFYFSYSPEGVSEYRVRVINIIVNNMRFMIHPVPIVLQRMQQLGIANRLFLKYAALF